MLYFMGIGFKINQLAESRNLPLSDLAVKLGKTKQAVYDLVKKDDVNTAIVRECARIFNVPVSYFFDEPSTENTISNVTGAAAINGNATASIQCQEKIDLLERILAEKERTIQLLLNQYK